MIFVPWRVKNFLSWNFPLLYHLAVNLGRKGNSPEHWDARLAETWDSPGRHWPSLNQLVAALTQPSEIILDVGCGSGGMLRDLRSRGYRNLHGMDISAYAVNRLRGEGIEMHLGKLPDIPLPDASHDVVISSFVLEHIVRRRRFVSELARVLKPGGRAFIFVLDDCLRADRRTRTCNCFQRSLVAKAARALSSSHPDRKRAGHQQSDPDPVRPAPQAGELMARCPDPRP